MAQVEGPVGDQPEVAIPDGTILLAAGSARTRWTLTLAAAPLREAGAAAVLPLVAHLQP